MHLADSKVLSINHYSLIQQSRANASTTEQCQKRFMLIFAKSMPFRKGRLLMTEMRLNKRHLFDHFGYLEHRISPMDICLC